MGGCKGRPLPLFKGEMLPFYLPFPFPHPTIALHSPLPPPTSPLLSPFPPLSFPYPAATITPTATANNSCSSNIGNQHHQQQQEQQTTANNSQQQQTTANNSKQQQTTASQPQPCRLKAFEGDLRKSRCRHFCKSCRHPGPIVGFVCQLGGPCPPRTHHRGGALPP